MFSLKCNVDGVARSKPDLEGIGSVLWNSNGKLLFMFSKQVGVKDSSEVEVLTILEALCMSLGNFLEVLILESDYFLNSMF